MNLFYWNVIDIPWNNLFYESRQQSNARSGHKKYMFLINARPKSNAPLILNKEKT